MSIARPLAVSYRRERSFSRHFITIQSRSPRSVRARAGGSVRRPIMTAYRQEALRCAALLEDGPSTLRAIRAGGDVPRAGRILQSDVYGWFERVGRGVYTLTPRGRAALEEDRADFNRAI